MANEQSPHPLQIQLDKIQFFLNKLEGLKANPEEKKLEHHAEVAISFVAEVTTLFEITFLSFLHTFYYEKGPTIESSIKEGVEAIYKDLIMMNRR